MYWALDSLYELIKRILKSRGSGDVGYIGLGSNFGLAYSDFIA